MKLYNDLERGGVITTSAAEQSPPDSRRRSFTWRAGVVAALLFVSYAYFYEAGGANQNSRFDAVRAIVEKRTLRIDAYNENTTDKAFIRGHWYSDKAPGVALLAVPIVAATRPILDAVGVDLLSYKAIEVETYVVTVITAGLATVVAAMALYWVARHVGASHGGATFAAIVFGLATPAWAYATLFWGHALATAALFIAFALAVDARRSGSARRDVWLGAGVGLAAGWAVVTEFPSAPPAALIAGLAVAHSWPGGRHRRVLVGLAGGALVSAVTLLAHNWVAFGSPFHFGYSENLEFVLRRLNGEKTGFFGHSYPKPHVMWELLFGRYRGLLPLAPLLVVGPFGIARLARAPETRKTAIVAGIIPLYYLLENSAFRGWYGGHNYGPRYLAAALPFLCLGLATMWTAARRPLQGAMALLALWGLALALIAVSTDPQPATTVRQPVAQYLWPAFRDGRLSLNNAAFTSVGLEYFGTKRFAWNVGERMGLSGHASLVPLAALWAAALAGWVMLTRDERRRGRRVPAPRR